MADTNKRIAELTEVLELAYEALEILLGSDAKDSYTLQRINSVLYGK